MCVYVCAACIDIYECIPQRKIQKNKHWNVDMTYFRAAGWGNEMLKCVWVGGLGKRNP